MLLNDLGRRPTPPTERPIKRIGGADHTYVSYHGPKPYPSEFGRWWNMYPSADHPTFMKEKDLYWKTRDWWADRNPFGPPAGVPDGFRIPGTTNKRTYWDINNRDPKDV